jgi:hypothetical protein
VASPKPENPSLFNSTIKEGCSSIDSLEMVNVCFNLRLNALNISSIIVVFWSNYKGKNQALIT